MDALTVALRYFKDPLEGLAAIAHSVSLKTFLAGLSAVEASDYEKAQCFAKCVIQSDSRGMLSVDMCDIECKRDGHLLTISVDYKELYPSSLFGYTLFLYDEVDLLELDDPDFFANFEQMSSVWVYAPPVGDPKESSDAIEQTLVPDECLIEQVRPKVELDRDIILRFSLDNAAQFAGCLNMIARSGIRVFVERKDLHG
jgi:hypothetical protein